MIRKWLRYHQLVTRCTKHFYVDDDFHLRVLSTSCLYIDQFRLLGRQQSRMSVRVYIKSPHVPIYRHPTIPNLKLRTGTWFSNKIPCSLKLIIIQSLWIYETIFYWSWLIIWWTAVTRACGWVSLLHPHLHLPTHPTPTSSPTDPLYPTHTHPFIIVYLVYKDNNYLIFVNELYNIIYLFIRKKRKYR
jgi:hypothetical protein